MVTAAEVDRKSHGGMLRELQTECRTVLTEVLAGLFNVVQIANFSIT